MKIDEANFRLYSSSVCVCVDEEQLEQTTHIDTP